MAVYTPVKTEESAALVRRMGLGDLVEQIPITEGTENSNYKLITTTGAYVMTLFERRTDPADLPYFVGLMAHLDATGIPVPKPLADESGTVLQTIAKRPGILITFLEGRPADPITPGHCCQAGQLLARMHVAGGDFGRFRDNPLGPPSWRQMISEWAADSPLLMQAQQEALRLAARIIKNDWPRGLPTGPTHSDLFPDNVFFKDGQLSGVIDFYFAADDILAYDIAVAINAWCFDHENHYRADCAEAMVEGYERERSLSLHERGSLNLLCIGAATRFTLTRLYDMTHPRPGAAVEMRDPGLFADRLRYFLSRQTNWGSQ